MVVHEPIAYEEARACFFAVPRVVLLTYVVR